MMSEKKYSDPTFSQRLLTWYDLHGRHNLPWQQDKTPYRVWISEIMLQQTQVTTVIPYYQRFMARFPHVDDLASASEDEVFHHWSGLGYYSRARNLHKAAKKVVEQHSGIFPRSVAGLMELPGIGRSTAGAIAAISMGIRAPIMDGNVKRILTRYFAIHGWPGLTTVANELWIIAEGLTPQERVGDYTQVMMDLGATLCKRSKPACHQCPLNTSCIACQTGQQQRFPESKPKQARPERSTVMLMVVNQHGEVLLEKRPPAGIWGGLWSFPEISAPDQIRAEAFDQTGLIINDCDLWRPFRHTFSHYHLDITPALTFVDAQQQPLQVNEPDDYCWFALNQSRQLGLAAPIKKLLEKINQAL